MSKISEQVSLIVGARGTRLKGYRSVLIETCTAGIKY